MLNSWEEKIWHESIENAGSTFFFTVPYKVGNPDLIKKIEANFSNNYQWQNKHVLVVEDDSVSYQYLHKILKSTKINIIHAPSGYEAVDICDKQDEIDLVLMDIQLPGINGYQATEKNQRI